MDSTPPRNLNLRKKKTRMQRLTGMKLFLFILPFMIMVAIFAYYPLFGWAYAFFDFKPPKALFSCNFVGFHWFTSLFSNKVKRNMLMQVMKNTFAMSGLGILMSWLPMAFAIFLAEIRSGWFKKVVQTFTTLPNFISWVLVYSMAFALFSSSGMVNTLLQNSGLSHQSIMFLTSDNHTWLKMWAWGTWKGLGWGSILYLASISGIDQEMYEAARVDGAGRFRTMWSITIPCLIPTYFVLLMLQISGFLNNGLDQYYVFANAFNMTHIQVLDLYVYNLGLGNGAYSLATAISIMKTIVSLVLLFIVNMLSKAVRGTTIV